MIRSLRIKERELRNPRAREKAVHRMLIAVPRTDTGALVEKTKT